MPRKSAKKLTKKEREKWFVTLYVNAGAQPENVADCEKRALLKPGAGQKILARKAVAQEVHLRMEPIRLEQFRQQTLTEAVQKAEKVIQEKLATNVTAVQRMKIDLEVLDHELMTMAVGLDKNTFPKEKLDALKAAYVVFGTLESGNTRRLIPPEHLQQNEGQGTYTSLFNRLKAPSESLLEARPAEDGVFDLIPRRASSGAVAGPLPPPGESIDESLPSKPASNVITVEVG